MRIDAVRYLGLGSAVATAAVAVSCSMGAPPAPTFGEYDGGGSEGGGGCGGPPTLSAIEQGIFAKPCAFGSCHGGANPAAGLNLLTGQACGSLLNKNSCVFSGRVRVVPGHPEQSYLYHKVAGDDLGTNPDGTCAGLTNGTPQRMPLGGVPLCQGQIDQIRNWISAGAICDDAVTDAGTDAPVAADSGPDVVDASPDVTFDASDPPVT